MLFILGKAKKGPGSDVPYRGMYIDTLNEIGTCNDPAVTASKLHVGILTP